MFNKQISNNVNNTVLVFILYGEARSSDSGLGIDIRLCAGRSLV